MQLLIGRETTFAEGIDVLIDLRNDLFSKISYIVNTFPEEAFYQMPFAGAGCCHSKTLAYSMWHIFRIEDIVAHTLISGDEQVLFSGGWQKKIGSPIVTTGNELKREEIAEFSKKPNIKALFSYCEAVMESTNELLRSLTYTDLKRCFSEDDKERVKDKLCQKARKGVDPIACCGLYCNHCFLKDWCGGCRAAYKQNKVRKLMFFNLHTLFYIAFGEKMDH